MRHSNPTCQASTQPSGKARPNSAGSLRQADYEQLDKLAEREAFLADFNPAERLQLSEAAKLDLDEEISMLSRTLRRFMRAAESAGEEDYPVNLAKALDLLGLTCSRMASLLRVNVVLLGPEKSADSIELLKRLTDFGQEVKQMGEVIHD
ncbi:MAG TPA: hypothetical protein PLH64_04485 [Anaerolineaceae bacterium]|nr:hypothetical protein [Anaerolineaceae bacterium]